MLRGIKIGNVLFLRNAGRGGSSRGEPSRGGGLDFVTEVYTVKGICRVLRYERGGGGSKMPIFALRNKRTFPYQILYLRGINEASRSLSSQPPIIYYSEN
jgi:hypothetical protein